MAFTDQVKALFIAARQLPASERPAFLAARCADNPDRRREVEALLELTEGEPSSIRPDLLTQASSIPPISMSTDATELAHVPPQIEGYTVISYLGAGAMGIVWKAMQLSIGRAVALKVIRPGILSSEKARLRFSREVRTCGNLEHPNIARVYDSGPRNGTHFCAMELIDGAPLDRYVRDHKWLPAQVLGLMETVCGAVDFAHQRGVIHRDLKPSNILVTADGQPHVLDFGLAKTLADEESGDERIDISTEGEIAGTVGYMSPEQASGKHKQIDARTDVYSLGAMLYRLLVGQPPIDLSCYWVEALRRIADQESRRPSELNRDIDSDLEAILLKSVARDQTQRHASAKEMAAAIARYRSALQARTQPVVPPPVPAVSRVALRVVLLHRRSALQDQYVLRLLESALTAAGHRVFVDRHLTIGTEWAKQIEQEIGTADAVIPLLSQESVQSEMVAYEVQVAHQAAQAQHGKPRLFPVRVAFEGPLGGELACFLDSLHYVLWRGAEDDRRLLDELLPALSARPKLRATERGKLESVGGAVPLDSRFYVVRPTDNLATDAITRRDSILLIKGARQVGKTSLLARSLKLARDAGIKIVLTDLQKLTTAEMSTLETFYKAIGEQLSDQLDLSVAPQDVWKPGRSPNSNFERFFRREVLEKAGHDILWAMDEADRLFTCAYSGEVFGLFRTWHNERALDPSGPWSRLTLAIAYATEAHLFINDPNQSPFNVGTLLALEDFTLEQVADLNRRHGSPLTEGAEVAAFYRLVGGQPYLIRRGFSEIVSSGLSFDDFASRADQGNGPYGDHLRRMLAVLARDREMCDAIRAILRGEPCPSAELFYRLSSGGVLSGASHESCHPRCEVYASYLRRHLL